MQFKHNSFVKFGKDKHRYMRKKQCNNGLWVKGKRGISLCKFLYASLQACQSAPEQGLERIEKSHCMCALARCRQWQGEISSSILIAKCSEKLYEPGGRWSIVSLHRFNRFIQESKQVFFGQRIHRQAPGKVIFLVKWRLLFPFLVALLRPVAVAQGMRTIRVFLL